VSFRTRKHKLLDALPQYGGNGWYNLISFGMRVNKLVMTAEDAKERNADRKLHGIKSHWWWSGRPVK
jgi:hypothetical protein